MPAEFDQFSIRSVTVNDLDAIRSLYFDVWGYNRPKNFDYWRYITPPDGICPATIAIDGIRIAGAYILWPARIRIANEIVLGGQSMDTMTHPDYRGMGIFSQLAEACYKTAASRGFKILYGFPNPASYPGFVNKLGWKHTGNITHWIRFIKPSQHSKVPAVLSPFADFAAKLLPKGDLTGFEIRREIPGIVELQDLLQDWRTNVGTCQIERNKDWFAWRYAPDSENDYQWISAYLNGELIAAGVWGIRNSKWRELADKRAHLVELLGDNPEGLRAVLTAVIEAAELTGAMLLETVCNVEVICGELTRLGFYRHRQAPFIVRGLGNTKFDIDFLAHHNWTIMGGDLDTF